MLIKFTEIRSLPINRILVFNIRMQYDKLKEGCKIGASRKDDGLAVCHFLHVDFCVLLLDYRSKNFS